MASILVIGAGGREHALCWKLAQSPHVEKIFVSPGNAGTTCSNKAMNISLDLKDLEAVACWCKEHQVSLVVVGPEDPLANGISDVLEKHGISCFGPTSKAAQIEASKEFAKSFMIRNNIPTARWKAFTDVAAAQQHIHSAPYAALVVKASGLAAGKGVVVAKDKEEACDAVRMMIQDNKYGTAGHTVIVEEQLVGQEVSCLAFCDGNSVACMPPAQDHKRLLDGDQGPNTGGMGAYCPCNMVSSTELESIQNDILKKTVDGLKSEGIPYIGVLYAGVMLTKDGPKVLEFNCRFGDPETQVLLPMMRSDLYTVFQSCISGTLHEMELQFYTDRCAIAVVTVSNGYPSGYKKGMTITGLRGVEEQLGHTVFHAGTAVKDSQVVTSGGRVLAVVAVEKNLASAAHQARIGASLVQYEGKFYRRDIAHHQLDRSNSLLTYKAAGVDIEAGESFVQKIKPLAAATKGKGCLGGLGQFGGLFDLAAVGYKDPILVSGTDGVGTKLMIAQECNRHRTVGQDLVAMCVNDVLCHGAEPLYFLDYFACGKLDVSVAADVIKGIADGCQQAGCTLIGGETAEMPSMYDGECYDLAGFTVGAVEKVNILPRTKEIQASDALIGLTSSGIHSNGFSLVRKVMSRLGLKYNDVCPYNPKCTLGEDLLTPTKIYSKLLTAVLKSRKVKAIAHITGGGLPGNVRRTLPKNCVAKIDASKWNIPSVFGWLSVKGNIEVDEMQKTFNLGVGMVLVVSQSDVHELMQLFHIEEAFIIGHIEDKINKNGEEVILDGLDTAIAQAYVAGCNQFQMEQKNGYHADKKRVAVLISGTGTNLQALIDDTQDPNKESAAEIVLVLSNKPGVLGLKRAEAAAIPTKVLRHTDYSSRVEFDMAVHGCLKKNDIDIVCLAGFMRILSGEFVSLWKGRLLNIHPSLLPSFKGAHAHRLALKSGVRLSGCTVHFVAEEVDAGAILLQKPVPVYPGDTEDSLAERIKVEEHKAFPEALQLVASGGVSLAHDGSAVWH